MDVEYSLVALSPDLCRWIDAGDGSGVNLTMPEKLPPDWKLPPKGCAHFEHRYLTPCD